MSNQTEKNPELKRNLNEKCLNDNPKISFLFGKHANSGEEIITNLKRAIDGAYYAKDWTYIALAETLSRDELASVELVSVDGVVPISIFKTQFAEIYPQLAEIDFINKFKIDNKLSDDEIEEILRRLFHWLSFPFNPYSAGKKSMKMLHGEAFPRILTQVTDASEDDLMTMLGLNQNNLLKDEAGYAAEFRQYRDVLITAGLFELFGSVMININTAIEKRKNQQMKQKTRGMTRRAFLGKTLVVGAMTAGVGAAISHNEIQRSKQRTKAAKDVRFANSVKEMEAYKERFRQASQWCIGHVNPLEHNTFRSAILAEKTKEALESELFQDHDGAKIVMGSAHMWDDINADVKDSKRREKLIGKHFQGTLIPLVDQLLKTDPRVNILSKPFIRKSVLNALASQIVSYDISEFSAQSPDDNFPFSLLGDAFSIKGNFVSDKIKAMLGKY